MSRRL